MIGRRKPVPVPLCLPQIPHDQIRDRTLATALIQINILQIREELEPHRGGPGSSPGKVM
jgi:hypothetical protein